MDWHRLGEAVTEITDEQVFGPQKEISDDQVFGDRMPDALQTTVPEAFLDRVRAGQALARITQSAIKEGGEGLWQGTPTGFEDEQLNHLIDMGVFHDPLKSKGGPLQMVNEAVMIPAAKLWEGITRATAAGIHGAGGAFGQIVEEFGGSQGQANRAKNEVINAGNWAMIEGGMGRFSRPSIDAVGVTDKVVGGLPRPEDFADAAKVLAPEQIAGAAIRSAEGKVFSGINHADAGTSLFEAGHTLSHTEAGDGFVTTSGRFVDRDQALKIAKNNEQLSNPDFMGPDSLLHARDLLNIEANLKRMWNEDGIHPAEAVHDAHNDAFLKNEIVNGRQYVIRPEPSKASIPEGFKALPIDNVLKKGALEDSPFIAIDGQIIGTGGDHLSLYNPAEQREANALRASVYRDKDGRLTTYVEARDGQTPTPEQIDTIRRLTGEQNARFGFAIKKGDEFGVASSAKNATLDEFVKATGAPDHSVIPMAAEDFESLSETGGKPGSLGAAATDPEEIPIAQQPANPPGRLAAAFKDAADTLLDIGRDAQMLTAPMARGTTYSMAIAKDFANSLRRSRWDWSRIDDDIAKRFTPEQRARMWTAADEESVSRQLGEPESMREHQGLATLTPEERAAVEEQHTRAQNAWVRARDIGMVEGDGLPAYTPRMIINAMGSGSKETALALDGIGRNLKTKTANMLKRKYLEAQETEAAAKAKYGDEAVLARDIRVLPLATSQLEDAIAGRTLINNIKDYGARTGADTVSEGSIPAGSDAKWFTLDHPAFKTWRPKFGEVDGKVEALKDADGKTIFEQVPIYVHGDFEGPLRAVLSQKSGPLYGGLMALKGKTMSLIMNSPMIHNAVEWGRALPAMPGKVATFKVYFEGNRAKNNVPLMHEAIDSGLVPIGHRFFNQDINGIMEAPDLTPGRSWTAKLLGAVPGLFDEAAGNAVKTAIDQAGNFWHNTLLWDRVADLQMGLYTNLRADAMAKGIDQQTASRMAAHFANRYAGALPKEAMSDGATKIANMLMFSRSFTMGNLGVIKDMLTGLPKDVLAQIERDMGEVNPEAVGYAKAMARRKAMTVVAADMALLYVGNSLMQNAFNVMVNDSTLEKELHGYVQRFQAKMQAVKEHPLELIQPLRLLSDLSSTSENEPGKGERIHVGNAANGTAIYMRNPTGKIGEEFMGYITGPLDMMRRKLGTIARPVWQVMSNDKGFGRKIYDPDADTPGKYLSNLGKIAAHIAGSQLPEGQIGAFSDLVKGEGDKKVNMMQAFGPFGGVTFAKGAPGGPAVGEMYAEKSRQEFRVSQAMPDIRRQIQRGDIPGAQKAMTDLGMDASYSRWVIKTTLNPATRLGPKAMRDFYRTATPEQRARMERAQQASPPQ